MVSWLLRSSYTFFSKHQFEWLLFDENKELPWRSSTWKDPSILYSNFQSEDWLSMTLIISSNWWKSHFWGWKKITNISCDQRKYHSKYFNTQQKLFQWRERNSQADHRSIYRTDILSKTIDQNSLTNTCENLSNYLQFSIIFSFTSLDFQNWNKKRKGNFSQRLNNERKTFIFLASPSLIFETFHFSSIEFMWTRKSLEKKLSIKKE